MDDRSMEPLNFLILIHVLLFLAAWGYAELLDRIHDIYAPDHIWITVAVGIGLIILAIGGVCAIGLLPWQAMLFAFTLSLVAGIPIVRWQRRQAKQRAVERAAAKERKR